MRRAISPLRAATLACVVLAAGGLAACGGTTASRTATGAAAGAATGAAVGSTSANAGKGALIGAGVGALGGYMYDQHEKEKDRQEARDRYYQSRY